MATEYLSKESRLRLRRRRRRRPRRWREKVSYFDDKENFRGRIFPILCFIAASERQFALIGKQPPTVAKSKKIAQPTCGKSWGFWAETSWRFLSLASTLLKTVCFTKLALPSLFFIYFHLFYNAVDNAHKIIADVGVRTMDLWCWKQLLCQLLLVAPWPNRLFVAISSTVRVVIKKMVGFKVPSFMVTYKFHWNTLSPKINFTFIECRGGRFISWLWKGLPAKFGECAQGASFGECATQPYSVKVNLSEISIRPLLFVP